MKDEEKTITIKEYEQKAMRTNKVQSREEDLSNAALGLCGESGEFADHIKKYLHQGHELNLKHLKNEIGDILWYAVLACKTLGITLEDAMVSNISKLEKRYPDNCFNAEHSINRKD